jgi:phosphatidate cytidylyltransferase
MNKKEQFKKLLEKLPIKNNKLLTRCASGLVIGVLFITTIFALRPLFYILFYVIAALMLFEWHNMTSKSRQHRLLGLFIIPIPILALLLISYIDANGWLLFTFFTIIWSVDIMAMFGGNLIRGPKLAPKLSPNKTISGLVVGVISAVIVSNLIILVPSYFPPYGMISSHLSITIFALIIGLIAQASDLFISYFKRKFNVKDTGNIIPGHGGVLDRFDSIILTAPVVLLYCLYSA